MQNPRKLDLSVPEPSEGSRLDRFLAGAQPDLSRSRLQSLIRDSLVRVNGVVRRASHRLHAGDRVSVEIPAVEPTALEPEDLPLRIVHQDDDLLVIDKPAGLVVHPGAGVSTGTLVHRLLHHDPSLAGVGGEGRPGIVHRLDKDTSGLMVVARTPRAYRRLVEMMRERAIHRAYEALVWGDPRESGGEITGPIGRDPRDRRKMAVVPGGRPARTFWKVVDRFGPVCHVEIRLDTGRTHQIRVHLASRRLPVVGDPTYGGRAKKQLSLEARERSLATALLVHLPRQALHASRLELPHPTLSGQLSFNSHLPDDMNDALALLRAFRDGEGA